MRSSLNPPSRLTRPTTICHSPPLLYCYCASDYPLATRELTIISVHPVLSSNSSLSISLFSVSYSYSYSYSYSLPPPSLTPSQIPTPYLHTP